MRHRVLLAVLAIIIGASAAVVGPRPAVQADSVFVDVFVHEGGNKYLTCGWHGTNNGCGSGTTGALDWDNGDNADVMWRSWTLLSSSGTPAGAVDARPVDASSACTVVKVQTYDMEANYEGYVQYTHTENRTSNFNVLGKDTGYWDTEKVGTSVDDEPDGDCSFSGSHVHMTSTFSAHNHSAPSYYPTDSTCQLGVVTTDCGTKSSAHTYHYHFFAGAWSY